MRLEAARIIFAVFCPWPTLPDFSKPAPCFTGISRCSSAMGEDDPFRPVGFIILCDSRSGTVSPDLAIFHGIHFAVQRPVPAWRCNRPGSRRSVFESARGAISDDRPYATHVVREPGRGTGLPGPLGRALGRQAQPAGAHASDRSEGIAGVILRQTGSQRMAIQRPPMRNTLDPVRLAITGVRSSRTYDNSPSNSLIAPERKIGLFDGDRLVFQGADASRFGAPGRCRERHAQIWISQITSKFTVMRATGSIEAFGHTERVIRQGKLGMASSPAEQHYGQAQSLGESCAGFLGGPGSKLPIELPRTARLLGTGFAATPPPCSPSRYSVSNPRILCGPDHRVRAHN